MSPALSGCPDAQLVRQPGNAAGRIPHCRRAGAGVDHLAVPGKGHADKSQVQVVDLRILPPTTNRPDEALSATVSTSLIFQSATRLSTISTDGDHPGDGRQRTCGGHTGSREITLHDKGRLGLDARLQQTVQDR